MLANAIVFTFAPMTVVAPYLTFPRISWWAAVMGADTVIFDTTEHFQKMTDRNKYHISGANNSNKLSVPLVNGRDQRAPMHEIRIHNEERWQVQHWRTIVSVYRRTPYFEHYEDSLRLLFEDEFTHLVDFNRASIQWVKRQLKLKFEEQEATVFTKEYPPDIMDIRFLRPAHREFSRYHQIFEDRIGFLSDLSILDLLFSLGPGAINYLRSL